MFVRVARFEGGNASGIDAEISRMRESIANPDQLPAGLRSVKRVIALVDRKSGNAVDLTFCETEDDLRAADEALNSMSPISDASGRRTSVETFEMALDETIG